MNADGATGDRVFVSPVCPTCVVILHRVIDDAGATLGAAAAALGVEMTLSANLAASCLLRCRALLACLVVGAVAAAPSASAQGRSLPLERFEVATDHTGFGSTEGGGILGHLEMQGGGVLNYTLNPLVVRDGPNGDRRFSIVGHRVVNELHFAIGLYDYVQIGVTAPFVLLQVGDDLENLKDALGQTGGLAGIGLGDVRVVPKVRLLREDKHFVNVALLAHLSLPTASGISFTEESGLGFNYGESFLGNGPLGFALKPELAVSANPLGIRLAGNLGWRLRPTINYLDRYPITPEFTYRVGVGYDIGQWIPAFTMIPSVWEYNAKQQLLVYAEVFGATADRDPFGVVTALTGPTGDEALTANQTIRLANAAEWSVGSRWNFYKGWHLEGAVGSGMLPGFGTPDLRLWGGVRYVHKQTDRDGDGIEDKDDQCPDDKEDIDQFDDTDGCPDIDNDKDAVLDVDDKCINEAEDIDQFEDTDGCPDIDNDKDGILDDKDACPNEVGIADLGGCPRQDRDGDGVEDLKDKCPDEAGPKDNGGCPIQDSDKDGVLDAEDECPNEAGPPARKGCPLKDADSDGVEDKDDACPNVPGPVERKGCPVGDKDGDGVIDDDDKCPEQPGVKDRQGCPIPDRDQDGIPDEKDKCPDEKGPEARQGCPIPDKDGDGIEDGVDACPDKAGAAIFKGCPDTDGDGVEDAKDKCPNDVGLKMFEGCGDKDEDGIPDHKDKCPEEKEVINGVKDEDGCPDKGKMLVIIKKEKIEIIEKVYFATGRDRIQKRSFGLLDQVALTLKATPRLKKIRVEGHTDSQGSAAGNKSLSDRRANAVKRYLIGAGVEPERLEAQGFGEERPIDTNDTPEGRQNNRRVEFVILEQ